MKARQRETAFLRQVILYDDTAERRELEERITQLECQAFCVRRAIWLMAVTSALATAGLGYCAIFLADFPQNMTLFGTRVMVKAFFALGLGSLISLLAFGVLSLIYRKQLDQRREECRRLVARLLEARLGKPRTSPLPGVVKEQEIIVTQREMLVPAPESVKLSRAPGKGHRFSWKD
ncbi:MAG: hypothetical protein ABI651_09080 [Verrucomicrobiota bacterium]